MYGDGVYEYVRATRKKFVEVKKHWWPEEDEYVLQVPARSAAREFVDVSLSQEQAENLFEQLKKHFDKA